MQAQVRTPKPAVFGELVRVAHWDEGGQYFQIADRVFNNLMRDHIGNICDRVGQNARAEGMMMCREFYRGLISENGSKGTERRGTKTKRARMQKPAEKDL